MNNAFQPAGENAARFCGQCGAPLTPGDRFCGACGAAVEASGPVAVQAETRAPAPPPARPAAPLADDAPRKASVGVLPAGGGRAFASAITVWTAGWALGGLIGAFLFAEILHRHALFRGQPLPGISIGPPFGTPPQSFVAGIDGGGILYWGLCGLIGGAIAATVASLRDRRTAPQGLGQCAIAVLIWTGAIAVLMNSGLILLPLFGALNGAIYAWRRDRRGDQALPSILWTALGWFAGTIAGLALVWLYQHA